MREIRVAVVMVLCDMDEGSALESVVVEDRDKGKDRGISMVVCKMNWMELLTMKVAGMTCWLSLVVAQIQAYSWPLEASSQPLLVVEMAIKL